MKVQHDDGALRRADLAALEHGCVDWYDYAAAERTRRAGAAAPRVAAPSVTRAGIAEGARFFGAPVSGERVFDRSDD